MIRFWAAQGLLMLANAAQPAVGALTERLTNDPSPHVRVRLQAINALTYVGVAALPYMPVVERAATSTDEYVRNAGRYLRFVLTGTYTPQSPVFGT